MKSVIGLFVLPALVLASGAVFAGTGGSDFGAGAYIIQEVSRLVVKLAGMF